MRLSSKRIEKLSNKLKVYSFDTVDSTNNIAKKLATNSADEGAVVVATKQTAGRGRLGRTFLSERGGVYFSVVLRPDTANSPLFITVAAAVAAARAIERVSCKKCELKWVNDVYIDGKKVCGILTEGCVDTNGKLDYAILGVGINVFEPKKGFPKELPLASSIFAKKCKILFKKRVKELLIAHFADEFFAFYNNLDQKLFINEYKQKSFLTGKQITYIKDGKEFFGTVEGIDDEARLIVSVDNKTQVLSSGEIQIVGMEQPII